VARHPALVTAACAEVALTRIRQYTFAHRHLAPQGVRRGVTGPLQADVQPLLLARRQQQHVVREADLGAQSDRSSSLKASIKVCMQCRQVHLYVFSANRQTLCCGLETAGVPKHLDADGDGAG
jgi:hypothetical protein